MAGDKELSMDWHSLRSVQIFAQAYTAAWCSQNPENVAACYEENGSLKVNDDAPAVGRNAIAAVAQGFMTQFPDMEVSLDDVQIQNDEAVYHWTLRGTDSGPGGTGRSVRISGFEVWQIGPNGLVASSQGNFDSDDYQRQLGK
jgi:uncharacterized protein (TIGR02246 family)